MSDAVEISVALASAADAHPSLVDFVDYYDAAERMFTGQIIETVFQITPEYERVLEQNMQTLHGDNWQPYYDDALQEAQKFTGQMLGLCGFPDRVNYWVNNLDPGLPGLNMMGCCASGTVRAPYAVWKHIVTGDTSETRVNMSIYRDSPLVEVIPSMPKRGEINIIVKTATRVLVRPPSWAVAVNVKT